MIPSVAVDRSSLSSDRSKVYYTNPERSKVLKFSNIINLRNVSSGSSSSAYYYSANNSSPIRFNSPQAHSSPIKRTKSKHNVKSQSNEAVDRTLNITESSRTPCTVINVLNTKQPSTVRSMKNISIKVNTNEIARSNLQSSRTLNSNPNQSENIGFHLHNNISDQVDSMNNQIEDCQSFSTIATATVASDNSKIANDIISTTPSEYTKYDGKFLNKTDSSEDIFQMGLNFKMFPTRISPYINSLKLDYLRLLEDKRAQPKTANKQAVRRLKTVRDIIKNINNNLESDANVSIKTESNRQKCSTVQFLPVDFNALDAKHRKWDRVNSRIESLGLKDKKEKIQKLHEKSTTTFDGQYEKDYMELGHSNRFLSDFESLEPIINGNEKSLTENTAFDTSQRIRESNKSIDLTPPANENNTVCNDIYAPSRERSLDNFSLNDLIDLQDKDISEIVIPDINLRETEFLSDTSTPANKSFSNNSHVEISNIIQEEKTENQYSLRKCPKSTQRFTIAPLRPTPVKRKSICVKNKYINDDFFACRGAGKNKVVLQYKVNSVFKANSSELMKKINPESVSCSENNNRNATHFDFSNMIPKQNGKPCRCGIFPSQVPPSWHSALHKYIHQNLHKLRFKSQTVVDVVSKCNDNGFRYDIMNVTKNSNNDKDLKLTLKNINEFINIELNHSKNNNSSNHSIFIAVNPNSEIIGYLEIESLKNACIFQNNEFSEKMIAVKFGVSKLWVMVKYRNNGVASNLIKQFCHEKKLNINDIAFDYRGGQGISFIKKYFKNNSVLIY